MKFIFITFLLFSTQAMSEVKKNSQEEFDKKVKAEVERQVNLIKKKSLSQLTKELLEKDRTLMKRDEKLDKREEQIKISENSLLKKIEELESTKTKIIGCLDDHKKGELMRVKQLVEVISNMKPQKAADLLSVQESKISIKIIERIKPEKASKIFNLMEKEVSARLQKQYLNMQQ
jgi:flagellar motility protein MotE (MotC chaperone)